MWILFLNEIYIMTEEKKVEEEVVAVEPTIETEAESAEKTEETPSSEEIK